MDRNRTLAVFFLFLIVADVSDARPRILAAVDPIANSTTNPVLGAKKPDPKPIEANKTIEKKPEVVQAPKNPSLLDPKVSNKTVPVSPLPQNQTAENNKTSNHTKSVTPPVLNPAPVLNPTPDIKKTQKGSNSTDNVKNSEGSNTTGLLSPPPPPDKGKPPKVSNGTNLVIPSPIKETDNEKKNDGAKEKEQISSEPGETETCEGLPNSCTIQQTLIACIQNFDAVSRELTVLVQNEGEKSVPVILTVPDAVEITRKQLKVSKHRTEKTNILLIGGKSTELIVNAGKEECMLPLPIDPLAFEENPYLPSYHRIVSPINGAYLMIITVIILGGIWACCKFRRRKFHDGVPYQELEMALPVSVSATDLETAEGWDEGWDDDWEGDSALKSPAHIGNISANGLTSRTSNRDGWENDWDD